MTMALHIRISCPHCHRSGLRLRNEYLGRRVHCKHCGERFVTAAEHVTDWGGTPPTVPPPPPEPSTVGGPEVSPRESPDSLPDDARVEVERLRERARDLEGRLAAADRAARRRADELAAREDALRARLEEEAAGRRDEAHRSALALEEARGRADAAERLAERLRGELDRLGDDRKAEREAIETASQAVQRELDQSRSREAAERAKAAALSDALAELERRLEEAARSSASHAGPAATGPPREADGGAGDGGLTGRVEDLTRQLAELRRSNRRLCSLLDVFGLPKEIAAGRPESPKP